MAAAVPDTKYLKEHPPSTFVERLKGDTSSGRKSRTQQAPTKEVGLEHKAYLRKEDGENCC